jgi:hypothetical protein
MRQLSSFAGAALVYATVSGVTTVDLQPHTAQAFESYSRSAEERSVRQAHSAVFLWTDADPARRRRTWAGGAGAVIAEPALASGDIAVLDGIIHDWIGAAFVPGVTLAQTIAFTQDYDSHARFYRPEVQESKTIRHDGNEFDIYLRLLKRQVITVVLNTNHRVRYFPIDEKRCYSVSHSTRLAEVKDAGEPDEAEMPPGHDHGFLWRLDSYWRFEERDGGVYVECEAISLSRSVPAGLAWFVNPIIRSLPRESLAQTLGSLRTGVLAKNETR